MGVRDAQMERLGRHQRHRMPCLPLTVYVYYDVYRVAVNARRSPSEAHLRIITDMHGGRNIPQDSERKLFKIK